MLGSTFIRILVLPQIAIEEIALFSWLPLRKGPSRQPALHNEPQLLSKRSLIEERNHAAENLEFLNGWPK